MVNFDNCMSCFAGEQISAIVFLSHTRLKKNFYAIDFFLIKLEKPFLTFGAFQIFCQSVQKCTSQL